MDVHAKVFSPSHPTGKSLLLQLTTDPIDPDNIARIRESVKQVGITESHYNVKYSTADRSTFALFYNNNDIYMYAIAVGDKRYLLEGNSEGFTVTEGQNKSSRDELFSLLTMDEITPSENNPKAH